MSLFIITVTFLDNKEKRNSRCDTPDHQVHYFLKDIRLKKLLANYTKDWKCHKSQWNLPGNIQK